MQRVIQGGLRRNHRYAHPVVHVLSHMTCAGSSLYLAVSWVSTWRGALTRVRRIQEVWGGCLDVPSNRRRSLSFLLVCDGGGS